MNRPRFTRKDDLMPKTHRSAALAAALLLSLPACGEFPGRPAAPPSQGVAATSDTTIDSTPAAPSRSRSRPARPRRTTDRPSAADVAGGPLTPSAADSVVPQAPPAAPRPSPSLAPRRDLQRLVTAQEQHIANVGRYASRMQYLALRYMPQAGVNLIVESASDSGWVGRATRDGWPGGSCVVWVGRVPARPQTDRHKLQSSQSGVAVCDST